MPELYHSNHAPELIIVIGQRQEHGLVAYHQVWKPWAKSSLLSK
jgi:hypothetical protein